MQEEKCLKMGLFKDVFSYRSYIKEVTLQLYKSMFKLKNNIVKEVLKTIFQRMCLEKQRLEEQIKLVESQLNEFPEGRIICKRNEKRYKWYHSQNGKLTYISKKGRKLAEQLAAKKYLTHLYEDLIHEKNAIDYYIRHHKEGAAEKMLTQMPEYQELLMPYFKVLSQELYEWQNSPYDHCMKYPEQRKHKTTSGNIVRSKSELLIDMTLYKHKIPFRYECALQLEDEVFYPDFTIRHPETGEVFYWEHFGKMDNERYAKNTGSKLQFYIAHGIIPGVNLITTYETKDKPLSIETVENLIQEYFE